MISTNLIADPRISMRWLITPLDLSCLTILTTMSIVVLTVRIITYLSYRIGLNLYRGAHPQCLRKRIRNQVSKNNLTKRI
jgi:hypothetical protein